MKHIIRYYKNGKPVEGYWENEEGHKHGTYRAWYANGKLWLEAIYKNGRLHGKYKEWYSDGMIKYETGYINGNLFHGKHKLFYGNGQIQLERNYINGSTNGICEKWRLDGGKAESYYYIDHEIWRNKRNNIKGWNKLEQLIQKKKERRLKLRLEMLRNKISKLDTGVYSTIINYLSWDEKMKILKDYRNGIVRNKRYRRNWLVRSYQKKKKLKKY